jgi:hypothetical protein
VVICAGKAERSLADHERHGSAGRCDGRAIRDLALQDEDAVTHGYSLDIAMLNDLNFVWPVQ